MANQRERLLGATAAIFAEQGYASLAIGTVITRAGVSRSTFYKFFDDKLDCVLAAQRRAFEALGQTIAWACAAEQDWPRGVARAVGAALAFAARFPGEARLVLASSQVASEPALARQGLPAHARLIELLHDGSQRHPGARSPSSLAEQAAIGAAMSIVGAFLAAGKIDALAKSKAASSKSSSRPIWVARRQNAWLWRPRRGSCTNGSEGHRERHVRTDATLSCSPPSKV